jgi:hypothetical protein
MMFAPTNTTKRAVPPLIRRGDVDQQVDVARGAREAGLNHGHPANHQVGCTRRVQIAAEGNEVR